MSESNYHDNHPCEESIEALNLILESIGKEEIALAHIMESEGEKIQAVLGKRYGDCGPSGQSHKPVDIKSLLLVNKSVRDMLGDVVKKEILLMLKLDSVLDYLGDRCCGCCQHHECYCKHDDCCKHRDCCKHNDCGKPREICKD